MCSNVAIVYVYACWNNMCSNVAIVYVYACWNNMCNNVASQHAYVCCMLPYLGVTTTQTQTAPTKRALLVMVTANTHMIQLLCHINIGFNKRFQQVHSQFTTPKVQRPTTSIACTWLLCESDTCTSRKLKNPCCNGCVGIYCLIHYEVNLQLQWVATLHTGCAYFWVYRSNHIWSLWDINNSFYIPNCYLLVWSCLIWFVRNYTCLVQELPTNY